MRCFPILGLSLSGFVCQLVTGTTILSDLHALGLSTGSQIGSPSDSNFTQRWSTYNAPKYVAAVKPVTDRDVAKIIKYAATSKTPILTTGGGHGYTTTLGRIERGIELDLSNFNQVEVDAKANKLTVGGAVRFGDILARMGKAHKEIPIGADSCVGMVGATLGGGISRYNGLHGMILDSLLSVKMVTAAGDIVTASKTSNPDLFWGIRGAGFNYGTILEATYNIYDETAPKVLMANYLFPPSASESILEYFKSLEKNLPAKLSLILLGSDMPAYGGSVIIINAVYAGAQEEGEELLKPLLNASPIKKNLTMVPWAEISAYAFFGKGAAYDKKACPKNSTHNVYGGAVSSFDIPTFQTFYKNYDKLLESMPDQLAGTNFFIEFVPKQATEAVPADATSYPWRDITAHLLFSFAYDVSDKALDNQINSFMREARKNFTAASGFAQPQLYVSYGHGDEDLATLYSEKNLPKLLALKAEWDPTNVYRYNQPLI